ncbi:MAG: hypothetical protein NTW42_01115 [Deltaproteobacteria bacterium]|nr:hypothetical protein [Deltaproteobacteria bacterium]
MKKKIRPDSSEPDFFVQFSKKLQGVGWEQEENVGPGQNNLPEAAGGGKEWEMWS